MPERDIDNYQQHYDELPFEAIMVDIRKKAVLDFLKNNNAKHIIEVGCGNSSILNNYTDFDSIIVVEPSKRFVENVEKDVAKLPNKKVIIINDFFSAAIFNGYDITNIDAIIISGLLHEIPDPAAMLQDAYAICNTNTVVHVNVPNANSLHRIMALEMGYISSLKQKSEVQQQLQQHHTFDMESLKQLATNAGFTIINEGGFLIKPFTHKQMEVLRTHPLFGEKIIEGFEKLIKYLPDYGTEIFLELRKQQ